MKCECCKQWFEGPYCLNCHRKGSSYADLSIIPKPLGFEFRDKLSSKTQDPTKWTGVDALFDASERIKGKKISELVVYWWEEMEDGKLYLRWANSTSSLAEHGWILQRALNALQQK